MTDYQKKLVRDYGPSFIARARIIQNEMMKLATDAASIFTDEEWAKCAEAMLRFSIELSDVGNIARERVKETLNEGEDFIDFYGKAKEQVKRFI